MDENFQTSVYLSVIIQNRQRILLQEELKAVTSYNERGIFDVLPEHANFICLIKEFLMVHRKNGKVDQLKIERGILKVQKNTVHIYLV